MRKRRLEKELPQIDELYVVPLREIYDYLKIGPKHGSLTEME
ncbi:MAG: hypothetical protein ABIJ46_05075 [bacterium]